MLALARPHRWAWRRRVSVLVAAAFGAFIATQAPHLVHHFFEPEHVRNECPFASTGDRTSGLETRPLALVAVADVSTPCLAAEPLTPPSIAPAASRGRAPPAPTS